MTPSFNGFVTAPKDSQALAQEVVHGPGCSHSFIRTDDVYCTLSACAPGTGMHAYHARYGLCITAASRR